LSDLGVWPHAVGFVGHGLANPGALSEDESSRFSRPPVEVTTAAPGLVATRAHFPASRTATSSLQGCQCPRWRCPAELAGRQREEVLSQVRDVFRLRSGAARRGPRYRAARSRGRWPAHRRRLGQNDDPSPNTNAPNCIMWLP
jgi:hypothetical protein